MNQAATEALIRAYYDAFNRGDAEGVLACLADDVVHDVNQGVRRKGKAAFRAFCQHMSRCYREQLTEIVVMAAGDGAALRRSSTFTAHISRPTKACRRQMARPTSCRPVPSLPSETVASRA